MHIPVHSPRLRGYIYIMQIVLVMLTMAGLFLDRSHIPNIEPIRQGPDRKEARHRELVGTRPRMLYSLPTEFCGRFLKIDPEKLMEI